MGNPVIFTVTSAGKNAALDAQNRGLKLSLSRLTLGTSKWTATKTATDLKNKSLNFTLVSGDVETQSNTLRFSVTMSSDTVFDAYEMGLYTDTGVLFAIATSSTQPLVRLHPDVAIVVGSFGLHLGDVDASSVTVVSDPSSPIAVQMMENHLAHNDPHPQYLKDSEFNTAAADIIRRLVALESKEIIPVGGLFITTNHYETGADVTRALGYGKWERYGQGMTLVGQDPNAKVGSNKAWWATMNNIVGEFEHKLTITEMPEHKHRYMSDDQVATINNHNNRYVRTGHTQGRDFSQHKANAAAYEYFTFSLPDEAGGDKPHNNIQPSIVTAMWIRMPETGSIPNPKLYTGTDASSISTGGINEGIVSQILADAESLNRQLTERLATAVSRLSELEKQISQAGGSIGVGGDAPEWQAVVSTHLGFALAKSTVTQQDGYGWVQPVLLQTLGYKKVSIASDRQSSQNNGVMDYLKITLTFDDASDFSEVQIQPEPSNLIRNDEAKTLSWGFDSLDNATSWTLMID